MSEVTLLSVTMLKEQERMKEAHSDIIVTQSLTEFDQKVRKKQENKIYQLLAELVETERNYVKDLEKVCQDYLPLCNDGRERNCRSLDRKQKRILRHGFHTQSWPPGAKEVSKDEIQELQTIQGLQDLKNRTDIDIPISISGREVRQMLGNIEDIKDYHKRVILPRMEEAVVDSNLMRTLFQSEKQRLLRKYGRYCINNSRSSIIIDSNIKFLSLYQSHKGLRLRVDAQLIKPIQRLTRYHMFLSSLSSTCQELDMKDAANDFSVALESILDAANHTNTMMWIGGMYGCPLDLSGLGQLLKHGPLHSIPIKSRKWSIGTQKMVPGHLFLFQQSLVLCKTTDTSQQLSNSPNLDYITHISVNQVRVRDVIEGCQRTFELHKLENIKAGLNMMGGEVVVIGDRDTKEGVVARIVCSTEKEKEEWVRAVNNEVKQLRNVANELSRQIVLPGHSR